MSDLKKQADELGIEIDGRWSDETLQEQIDAKLAEKPAKAGKTVPVVIRYNVWTKDGKVPKGSKIDLPVQRAKALIKEGKAERADPFPGDE